MGYIALFYVCQSVQTNTNNNAVWKMTDEFAATQIFKSIESDFTNQLASGDFHKIRTIIEVALMPCIRYALA